MPGTRVHYITRIEDLPGIEFTDGMAAVEVPIELVDQLPLVNDHRMVGPRYNKVKASIRAKGYSSTRPIVCRIGMKGRWVVTDGGHRLTAAREVSREWWWNLICGKRVTTLYFLLFTTPGSWSKTGGEHRAIPLDEPGA